MELNRLSIGYMGDLIMWNNIALMRGWINEGVMAIGINMTLMVELFNIRYMGKLYVEITCDFMARINTEYMSEWFNIRNIWENLLT
jgi:hypothetical protein